LVLRRLEFHHFVIPIAAAMVAIGLALIAAPFDVLQILGADLVLAIGNALIVFGVFCISSYAVVRAVEWADQRLSHQDRNQSRSKSNER
jgi:hypothetical protein